jgi:hypothetical protein
MATQSAGKWRCEREGVWGEYNLDFRFECISHSESRSL